MTYKDVIAIEWLVEEHGRKWGTAPPKLCINGRLVRLYKNQDCPMHSYVSV